MSTFYSYYLFLNSAAWIVQAGCMQVNQKEMWAKLGAE